MRGRPPGSPLSARSLPQPAPRETPALVCLRSLPRQTLRRVLVIGADKRLPLLPDVPTLKEAGAPGDLLISTYFTLRAPSSTTKPAIDAIHAAVAPILNEAEFVRRFAGRGLIVGASESSNVEAGISADGTRLDKLIKDAGVRLD